MQTFYISYIDLSPGLENKFSTVAHKPLIESLRNHVTKWDFFDQKYSDYSIGFIIATKDGVKTLELKGPTMHNKRKVIDFSIFLPTQSYSLSEYIDFVFKGMQEALKIYNVSDKDILAAWGECKKKLDIA